MKEKLNQYIDNIRTELTEISDYIFDHPETAFEEVKASNVLTNYLEKNGFSVERGVGSLNTAFRAVYENGTGGPSIGLLCEYDALSGMGHACGHHMQGPAIAGAAVAVKELYRDKPYKLVIYGTPGEEGKGGKLFMLADGAFKDIDIALMTHAGPATQTDIKSMASASITVTYHGKSAHAALNPDTGRSALDALLLCFQGVEFLREHVKEDTRMHYAVSNGGGPCNVVPSSASGQFSLRSYNSVYLDEIQKRFESIVEGAALMTGTTYEIRYDKRLEGKIPVLKLNSLLMENARLIGAPKCRPDREKTGSTDFGNVMYQLPGACIRIAFVDDGIMAHSEGFLKEGKTERGHDAVVSAAKILADTTYDLIAVEGCLEGIQTEFKEKKVFLNNRV